METLTITLTITPLLQTAVEGAGKGLETKKSIYKEFTCIIIETFSVQLTLKFSIILHFLALYMHFFFQNPVFKYRYILTLTMAARQQNQIK